VALIGCDQHQSTNQSISILTERLTTLDRQISVSVARFIQSSFGDKPN